jgi:hypothetical protein
MSLFRQLRLQQALHIAAHDVGHTGFAVAGVQLLVIRKSATRVGGALAYPFNTLPVRRAWGSIWGRVRHNLKPVGCKR